MIANSSDPLYYEDFYLTRALAASLPPQSEAPLCWSTIECVGKTAKVLRTSYAGLRKFIRFCRLAGRFLRVAAGFPVLVEGSVDLESEL